MEMLPSLQTGVIRVSRGKTTSFAGRLSLGTDVATTSFAPVGVSERPLSCWLGLLTWAACPLSRRNSAAGAQSFSGTGSNGYIGCRASLALALLVLPLWTSSEHSNLLELLLESFLVA